MPGLELFQGVLLGNAGDFPIGCRFYRLQEMLLLATGRLFYHKGLRNFDITTV